MIPTFPLDAVDPDVTEPRDVPIVATFYGHSWSGRVLHDVEAAGEWVVTWTDGINTWLERYDYPWNALTRFAALVCAVEQDVFLVHDTYDPHQLVEFVGESERFLSRVVHASSCRAGCDGTDPANHQV